jgi:hypothetical protein
MGNMGMSNYWMPGTMILKFLWIIFQIAAVVGVVLLSWFYFDRRYKKRSSASQEMIGHPPPGFEWTAEVFQDPKDGHTYRVYYDPESGERAYVIEKL